MDAKGIYGSQSGFTLIELSIVLVVIGLIVGGVLVGQDLVRAAAERAQISQIEKYNAAANTFRDKFGYLPGDMPSTVTSQFGFYNGLYCLGVSSRNGDGLLQRVGYPYSPPNDYEPALFWEDLSSPAAGKLIDLRTISYGAIECSGTKGGFTATGSQLPAYYMPSAKIGNNNYIYVYAKNSYNWYGISAPNNSSGTLASVPAMTVKQAYDLDAKIDDGLPTTGNVVAVYLNWTDALNTTLPTSAATDDPTTCYNSGTNAYSIQISNGSNVNCALSFRMQAGD
jgi:prepilin-type N-terminal cleavage/methylation domain-containing protein